MQEFHHSEPEEFSDLDLEALDDDLDDLDLTEEDEEYAADVAAIADLFHQLSDPDPGPDPASPAADLPEPERSVAHPEPGSEAVSPRPRSYLESHDPVIGAGSYLAQRPSPNGEPTNVTRSPALGNQLRNLLSSGAVLSCSLVAVLVALGIWLQPGRWNPFQPGAPGIASPDVKPSTLKAMDTVTLAERATQWLRQGHGTAGQQAVIELLDRQALEQAEAALAAVPRDQADRAGIHFLKGRLAWQSVQQGNTRYRLEDAQMNWESAVRQQPTYPLYYNVLGLVYYAQGKLDQADRTWFQALYLLEETQANQQKSAPQTANPKARLPGFAGKQQIRSGLPNSEILTAYAGLTLVLMKTAQTQPVKQRTELLNRAARLYEKVMVEDAESFQPVALRQNWMWTQQMIQDWQIVARQKP